MSDPHAANHGAAHSPSPHGAAGDIRFSWRRVGAAATLLLIGALIGVSATWVYRYSLDPPPHQSAAEEAPVRSDPAEAGGDEAPAAPEPQPEDSPAAAPSITL